MAAFSQITKLTPESSESDIEAIFQLAGDIQSFQQDTLPKFKKFWAQTGNHKALKRLIDSTDNPVSYEQEIEWVYEAGRYKTCCKLIFLEILLMENIKMDELELDIMELPAKDKLRLLFNKFSDSDDPILQQFCMEVEDIFIENNPRRVSWSVKAMEDLDLEKFVKIWQRWIVEYDTMTKFHTHKMRKAFLLRMKNMGYAIPSIRTCIDTEAERWKICL